MSKGWILASLAGVVVIGIAAVILPHNLRIRRLRRAVAALSDEQHDGLLAAIDAFAANGATACWLVDRERGGRDEGATTACSRVGGVPSLAPREAAEFVARGARFLLQIRVPAWMSSSPWRDRILCFFAQRGDVLGVLGADADPTRALPSAPTLSGAPVDALRPKSAGAPARVLREVRIPRVPHGEKKHRNLYAPRLLLQHVPGLRERVSALSSEADRFLAAVLAPSAWTDEIEMFHRIQVGGSPHWVQSPGTPKCHDCGKPMAFIAEVGSDASSAFEDAQFDVFYAFGCERHPDRIACVVQRT